MKTFIFFILTFTVFVGCAGKQYYEPKEVEGNFNTKTTVTPAYIKSINAIGATLDNNMFIDNIGLSKISLPKGYSFINNSNNKILIANKTKELKVLDTNETFKFKSNVIAASIKDNLIALVFSNNAIGLYDKNSKRFKLKKYSKPISLNDTRIAMPIFLDKIILYPTLDGKVIVANIKSSKVVKTLTIDPNNEIKNIILLKAIDDTLIAASSNVILSLKDGIVHKKEFFIQSYAIKDKFIYIAALDGTIMKLDLNLKIINKKKFKFAKFQAIAIGKNDIYAIESQGYMVKISNDFKSIKTYYLPFEEDEKIFTNNNKVYLEDKLIKVK